MTDLLYGREWEISWLTPEAVATDYPALDNQVAGLFPTLSPEERALIAALVVDTCPYCFAASRACQCWNDE